MSECKKVSFKGAGGGGGGTGQDHGERWDGVHRIVNKHPLWKKAYKVPCMLEKEVGGGGGRKACQHASGYACDSRGAGDGGDVTTSYSTITNMIGNFGRNTFILNKLDPENVLQTFCSLSK